MAVVATLVFGWTLDKWGSIRLMPFMLIPLALGLLVFAAFESLTAGLVGLLLMGVTQGGNSTISVAFWSEAYGTKHVGAIKALTAAFMVFGSAIGPIMTGRLIDLGYSFPDQMVSYVIYIVAVSALTYFAVHRFLRK
jgi:MFS family permease